MFLRTMLNEEDELNFISQKYMSLIFMGYHQVLRKLVKKNTSGNLKGNKVSIDTIRKRPRLKTNSILSFDKNINFFYDTMA